MPADNYLCIWWHVLMSFTWYHRATGLSKYTEPRVVTMITLLSLGAMHIADNNAHRFNAHCWQQCSLMQRTLLTTILIDAMHIADNNAHWCIEDKVGLIAPICCQMNTCSLHTGLNKDNVETVCIWKLLVVNSTWTNTVGRTYGVAIWQ